MKRYFTIGDKAELGLQQPDSWKLLAVYSFALAVLEIANPPSQGEPGAPKQSLGSQLWTRAHLLEKASSPLLPVPLLFAYAELP